VLGFIQNLLGNVVSFQRIYDKMVNAMLIENKAEVYYQLGRLMQIMLDFKPIEKESYEQGEININSGDLEFMRYL
jgi:hypothetical protein